jgi:hypothetical protein
MEQTRIMDVNASSIADIRKFIEQQLDKINRRYNISKRVTEADIDRYILSNPYLQPDIAYELVHPQPDNLQNEKLDGHIEDIYYNISIWVSSD